MLSHWLAFKLIRTISSQHKIKSAYVFTDNKGVLQRVPECNRETTGQYIFTEIEDALNNLSDDVTIHVTWCPGHQGILGNEAADFLASAATGRNDHPDRKLKANINKISSTLCQQINPEKKNSLQARISDLPIDVTALINQLASNHSPLHHHLFKAKRRLDPLCPHCSGRETSSHLMNFCHKYKAARRQLRSNAQWE